MVMKKKLLQGILTAVIGTLMLYTSCSHAMLANDAILSIELGNAGCLRSDQDLTCVVTPPITG